MFLTLLTLGYSCTATTATLCPAGQYTTTSSGLACAPCPAGYRCPEGATPIPCPAGYYQTGGNAECTICPAGSFCKDTRFAPVAVGAGQWAAAGSTYPRQVAPGQHFIDAQTEPLTCAGATGAYWDPSTYKCVTCPAGYFCPNSSASNAKYQCPAGFYSPVPGLTTCYPCPAGFACPLGASAATACSAVDDGTFSFSYAM